MIHPRTLQMCIVNSLVLTCLVRAEVLETWIIAGQSNAEGYGITESPISGLAPASTLSTIGRSDLNVTHSNVQMFQGANDSGLITMSAGMSLPPKNAWHSMNAQEGLAYDWGSGRGNESGRRFGPELAFGYNVQAQIGAPIALIKYARGGASIASATTQPGGVWLDYDPSDARLNHYDKLISTIQTAVNNLPAGQVLNVRGVVWMQGEGDATATFAPAYQANLTEFITTLRNDIGTIAAASGGKMTRSASAWSNLDVFLGTIQNGGPNHQTVINAQNAVAAADAHVSTVNATTGLSSMTVDDWGISGLHYDTAGQVLLGERFADAALSQLRLDNGVDYTNLAKYQKSVGSTWGWTLRPDLFATDGIVSNFHRWRSTNTSGQWLEIHYPRPVTIASAHVYTGVIGSTTGEIWGNFKLQSYNGSTWVDVPGSTISSNTSLEVNVIFNQSVTSDKFRLLNTDSAAVRSIREIAMFGPNVVDGVEQGYPIGTGVVLNLAHKRPATASSIDTTNYAIKAVDGYVDDSSRWLCATGSAGQTLEIDLLSQEANGDRLHTIGSAHLYSGDFATSSGALSDFTLESWNGTAWVAIPGATITGNTSNARAITFSSAVVASKVRLVNNTTGSAKVAELLFFPPRSGGYPLGEDVQIKAPPTAKAEDFSDATRHLRVSSASLKLGLVGGNAVFTNDAAGSDALEWQLLLNHRDGSYRIRNVKNGHCLALGSITTASDTSVIGETYTGMPHQCWFLDFVSTTQFRLINAYSGLALQSLGGSTTPGTTLAAVTPNSSTLQQWDTVWQAHFLKKGIAGTGSPHPDAPTETHMSYYYGKYQHTSWGYSWGREDTFPFLGVDHTFNPMQWGNFFWAHGSTNAPLEGDRVYMQSQGKPLAFLGFNEPDHTDQANMTVAQAVALWPRLQSMDTPMVGPCPANPTNYWNADFYFAVNQLGYRVDYTPLHWYDSPSSTNIINKIKQVYALHGRPVWITEFTSVRWSGTSTWTHASNYNFLAEFMWRAENLPELARYSLFNWQNEPGSLIDPPEAPRGNPFDENGNLTAYGELYASWDGVAQVLPQKAYHLHNHGYYQRIQSPATGNSFGFVTPDNSTAGTQWFLLPGTTAGTYRIQTTRDGRPLSRTTGNPAAMGSLGQVDTATEWTLVPVVSGADHDGWYYLQHPLTNQRLKNNGDGSCSMVATTDTTNGSKWRFIVPLVPEMQAMAENITSLLNQSVLIDVLANDGGRYGAPAIQSVGTPTFGTAVIENGKIRYTPPNGFTGNVQFTYTITDGTATDTATVTITVRSNQSPMVDAGPDQVALLNEVTPLDPTAGAYFEWDAANDAVANNTWTSTTANTYNWIFDSGNQTPATVTDPRFARITKAYAFPAAKDATNTSFDAMGSGQKATFEFVIDVDGTDGSIFESGGSGTGMQVDVVGGVLRGTVSASNVPIRTTYTLTPTDLGRFIHVVFVADNVANVVQLYVDGVLKDEQPWTQSEDWSGGDGASLGGVSGSIPANGATADFTGKLALFRFYNNKAFTVGEVATNLASLDGGRASTVTLDGTVADADADPLITTWTIVSGPGAVVFGNASAVDTTAIFTVAGTYVLQLSAYDGVVTTMNEVMITVNAAGGNSAPVWASNPITGSNATEDAAYSGTLASSATDANSDPLTFAKVSGPAWLSVAANGALTGTPTQSHVGANSFVVSVSDGVAAPVEATINITVLNVNDAPTITNIADSSTNEDTATSAISFTIGDAETAATSLTVSGTSSNTTLIPNGNIVFGGSGASRTVTVTPAANQTGTSTITVTVSDSALTATDTFVLTVISVNDAPVFTANPITGSVAISGTAYTTTLAGSATDADSDPLTYAKVSGPAWLNVAANGSLTGTPGSGNVGANSFTVSVSDGVATPVQATLNITVNAELGGPPSLSHVSNIHISNSTDFNISVYPGKAGYAGTGAYTAATGIFGDGTVEAYYFLKNQTPATTLNGADGAVGTPIRYADDGSALLSSVTNTGGTSFSEFSRGDVWTTNDPGINFSGGGAANFGGAAETISGAYATTGTIDISSFSSGTIYFLAGGYGSGGQTTGFNLTMSGPGQTNVLASNSIISTASRNMYVQSFTFSNADNYTTISYTHFGTTSGRSRIMGVIVDGATASPPSNSAPVWANNPITGSNATENAAYSGAITSSATDADSDPLTFAKVSGPAWINVAANGTLTGTPTHSNAGANSFIVSVSDGIAAPVEATLNITVNTTYETWATGLGLNGASALPSANSDGDSLTNLQEFAFGLDPTDPGIRAMSFVESGTLAATGTPILTKDGTTYLAVFTRRKDHANAGLTYTVWFSADLVDWTQSVVTPTLRTSPTDPGDYEAVSVPYPTSNPTPKFFRIEVSQN